MQKKRRGAPCWVMQQADNNSGRDVVARYRQTGARAAETTFYSVDTPGDQDLDQGTLWDQDARPEGGSFGYR